MSDKIIRIKCIRCLIREINDEKILKIIDDYKKQVNDKATEGLYESRLDTCKACKWLNKGCCMKCGMYVEARAFDKNNVCPANLWEGRDL